MVRICPNCNYQNNDDYDFCAKCGTPLTKIHNRGVSFSRNSKRKLIILSYIITIVFSWGGVIIYLLKPKVSYFGFFGIFMPFYLLQSSDSEVRKHGYIMLAIALVGLALFFILSFYK